MFFQQIINKKPIKSFLTKAISFCMLAFISFGLFSNVSVNAQGVEIFDILNIGCLFEGQTTAGGEKCTGEDNLLKRIVDFLTALSIPLAILVIIWGGYQYFVGGFDGKSNGKAAITAAITGLLIVTFAQFFVTSILGSGSDEGIIGAGGVLNVVPAIEFIRTIALALVQLAGALAVLTIMWGGYKYFFSGLGGKETGLKTIQNGIIGLLIVFITFSSFDAVADLSTSLAQGENPITKLTENLITPFIEDIQNILLTLATLFATVVLIVGGYKYFFTGLGGKEDGLKNIRNAIIGLVTIFLSSFIVSSIDGTLGTAATDGSTIGFDKAPILSFFNVVVSGIMLPVSSAVAVFFIVLAGFYYTTSGGDPKKAEKGQKAIKNAIIGLLLVLFAATIVAFIRFILGAGVEF